MTKFKIKVWNNDKKAAEIKSIDGKIFKPTGLCGIDGEEIFQGDVISGIAHWVGPTDKTPQENTVKGLWLVKWKKDTAQFYLSDDMLKHHNLKIYNKINGGTYLDRPKFAGYEGVERYQMKSIGCVYEMQHLVMNGKWRQVRNQVWERQARRGITTLQVSTHFDGEVWGYKVFDNGIVIKYDMLAAHSPEEAMRMADKMLNFLIKNTNKTNSNLRTWIDIKLAKAS